MAERFNIQLEFLGGISSSQQPVFRTAADAWEEVISQGLPSVEVNGEEIDDLLIKASAAHIDGPRSILGHAGPRHLRRDSLLPVTGVMEFDTADMDRMEDNGTLGSVIFHEMGHVLGIGTLWERKGLVEGIGTNDPVFVGKNAMKAYAKLLGQADPVPVPVANTGGEGTYGGHWRESVFGDEAMTGYIDPRTPLSKLTVASLKDLGYEVNANAADDYELPNSADLAATFLRRGIDDVQCCMCNTRRRGAAPTILPSAGDSCEDGDHATKPRRRRETVGKKIRNV